MSEATLGANFRALDAVKLRQRVLRNVDQVDLAASWFNQDACLPVALGPIGIAGMNARRGELQAAKAAQQAGIPFCLSTVSICSIEELARHKLPFWFQLYIMRDRSLMQDLLDRAQAAGCSTLVLTVDMPQPGRRYRDFRSGLAGSSGISGSIRRVAQAATRPTWSWDVGLRGAPHSLGNVSKILGPKSGLEDFLGWMSGNFDPTVTWADLERVRRMWQGTLILKGIMDTEDARIARDLGADGIVVSNHGGRQLDGTKGTAEVLSEIADALAGEMTLFADGGVRSGLDVVRMLALGAHGVWLGRAWAYALGAGGEAGVAHLIDQIRDEVSITMALCGVTSIDTVDRSVLSE